MALLIDDRTPYRPPAPPPPPPPPPTPPELKKAAPEQANASLKQMTPGQKAQLITDVQAMPVGERTDFLNEMAAKLEPSELVKLEEVFGKGEVNDAVETRSPADVRESYAALSAGRPDETAAPASTLPEDRQISLAREHYQDQVKGKGIASTHQLAELAKAHPNDQAYLAELAKLSREGGEMRAAVGMPPSGLYQKDPYGEYHLGPEAQGDSRRDAFANMVRAGLDRGTLNETDIRNEAAAYPNWVDVAGRIGLPQVGQTDASRQVAGKVRDLAETQKGAKEEAARLDKELGGLMAAAGPMTAGQQAKFISAFRNDPDHKGVYEKAAKTSQELDDYMAANRDAVLDASLRDPKAAQQVHDSIVALAESGHGVTALQYLADIQRSPDSALGKAYAKFGDLDGDVLTDAAAAAMAELMAKNDGSVADAQNRFLDLMKAFGPAKGTWSGYKEFDAGKKLLDAFATGDYSTVATYSKSFKDASPMMRAFTAAGVVTGAVTAAKKGNEGDYLNAIKGYAQAGEGGAKLITGALMGLTENGRMAMHAGKFAGAAGFAARLAPALGVVASAASFANSFKEAKHGNAGYGIALMGDALGVIGGALECTPVAPAGVVVSGIGAIISGLGSFTGELIKAGERRDEMRDLLKQAGVDGAIIEEMVRTGSTLHRMAKDLGMSPEQVQALIKAQPGIAFSPGHAQAFLDAAKACGLGGAQVQPFAEKLAQGNPEFAWDLFDQAGRANPSPEVHAQELRQLVETRYPAAADYAQQLSPALFGEAARQRDAAARDYGQHGFDASWELTVGNFLKGHADPGYRAEMIGRLGKDGRLQAFAENLSGYDDYRGDVRASIGDAQRAGLISSAEAGEALRYLS